MGIFTLLLKIHTQHYNFDIATGYVSPAESRRVDLENSQAPSASSSYLTFKLQYLNRNLKARIQIIT